MTGKPSVRRSLVTLGVVVTLLVAGATVRAAALWASGSAPLADAPVSATSIEAALKQEQARSGALRAQLDQLTAASEQLAGALATANDRLATDQTAAADLRASLDTAKAKLATLEAQLQAAHVSSAGSTTRTGAATGGVSDDNGIDD